MLTGNSQLRGARLSGHPSSPTPQEGEPIPISKSAPETVQWQQAAAAVYALAGGYADATGYLLARTFTGHVTGNLVLLAVSLQHPHWGEIGHRILAIVAFLLATGAGFGIARFSILRSPWILFSAQAFLIGAVSLPFVRGSQNHDLWLVAGLCLALGLQNGAITSAGGVSLHATFISGDVTSLIKLFLPDRAGNTKNPAEQKAGKPARLKGAILFCVVLSFLAGACGATWLIGRFGSLSPLVLLLPLGVAAILSTLATTASQSTKKG